MFTGIIRELGTVVGVEGGASGARIAVQRTGEPLDRGESIAVNGVCLTALPGDGGDFEADLSPETLRLTTLGSLAAGARVNLERALAMGDRLGGHLVQGHIDATGTLVSIRRDGEFAVYRWSFPEEYAPLVVEKGSVAVDGVSLTVVDPGPGSFAGALVPETLEKTTLGGAAVGDRVNLEFDVMAKFAQKLFTHYLPQSDR